MDLDAIRENYSVNNGQASGFRGKIILKRGLLNKLPYTFNGYFLANDHKDVRVIKWFLGVPNLRRSSPFISLCISYLA